MKAEADVERPQVHPTKISNVLTLKCSKNNKRKQTILQNHLRHYLGKFPNSSPKIWLNVWVRTVTAISVTTVIKAETGHKMMIIRKISSDTGLSMVACLILKL